MPYGSTLLTLLVAAASSARPALDVLKPEIEKAAREAVEIRYGATGTLARQIENGAPFDLFFAADASTPARLAEQGLLEKASLACYAVGRLSVVVASDAGLALPDRFDRTTAPGIAKLPFWRLALASPRTAPYGRAAEEALKNAGILDAVRPRIVYAENVEQALAFVASGNAELGFVAESLARGSALRAVPVDPALHAPLRQSAGVVGASTRKAAARRSLAAAVAAAARAVWERFGYRVP